MFQLCVRQVIRSKKQETIHFRWISSSHLLLFIDKITNEKSWSKEKLIISRPGNLITNFKITNYNLRGIRHPSFVSNKQNTTGTLHITHIYHNNRQQRNRKTKHRNRTSPDIHTLLTSHQTSLEQ